MQNNSGNLFETVEQKTLKRFSEPFHVPVAPSMFQPDNPTKYVAVEEVGTTTTRIAMCLNDRFLATSISVFP